MVDYQPDFFREIIFIECTRYESVDQYILFPILLDGVMVKQRDRLHQIWG
jgi:hypothetical protein